MAESGEIPPSPKEDTGESKATEVRERASVFNWLRDRGLLIYTTAFFSVATPFKHEKIEAAEIPPTATWTQGIKELHNGALSDNVESQASFYIDNQTKRGKWVFGKEGEHTKVIHSTTDVKKAIDRELSFEPTKSAIVCELHTHPLSAGETVKIISDENVRNIREGKYSVSFPPSGFPLSGGISIWNKGKLEAELDKFKSQGITVEPRYGVVDPAGITYHRIIKDNDLQQEFPEVFVEHQWRRVIYNNWEEIVQPLVENLDPDTLDRLHRLTKERGTYDPGKPLDYTRHFSKEEITSYKRRDVRMVLFGEEGHVEIAGILFKDNPKAQKLQGELVNYTIKGSDRDPYILDEARDKWIKFSQTVSPDQLPSSKEYAELREAFARNATYIRFVPHSKIPDEPPCAGTDYKP